MEGFVKLDFAKRMVPRKHKSGYGAVHTYEKNGTIVIPGRYAPLIKGKVCAAEWNERDVFAIHPDKTGTLKPRTYKDFPGQIFITSAPVVKEIHQKAGVAGKKATYDSWQADGVVYFTVRG